MMARVYIPGGGGEWKACVGPPLPDNQVVVENFQVLPYDSVAAHPRTELCDPNVLHFMQGTPVVFGYGEYGRIYSFDGSTLCARIACEDDRIVNVPISEVSYRMNMTIDELTSQTEFQLLPVEDGRVFMVPLVKEDLASADKENEEMEVNKEVQGLASANKGTERKRKREMQETMRLERKASKEAKKKHKREQEEAATLLRKEQ